MVFCGFEYEDPCCEVCLVERSEILERLYFATYHGLSAEHDSSFFLLHMKI